MCKLVDVSLMLNYLSTPNFRKKDKLPHHYSLPVNVHVPLAELSRISRSERPKVENESFKSGGKPLT